MLKLLNFAIFLTFFGIVYMQPANSNNGTAATSEQSDNTIEPQPFGLKSEDVTPIRDDVFNQTNFYRRKFKIRELTLNNDLNIKAQKSANDLAQTRLLLARPAGHFKLNGKVAYASKFSNTIGKKAVDNWYYELRHVKKNYTDNDLENNSHSIVHLIQLLWKLYDHMGVGVAKSISDDFYIVVKYIENEEELSDLRNNLPNFMPTDIDEANTAYEEYILNNTTTTDIEYKDEDVHDHAYETPQGLENNTVDYIRNQVLEQTNFYRRKHSVQALILETNMNNHAQEWANKLALNKNVKGRSKGEDNYYGENIYCTDYSLLIGKEAVNAWYYELRNVSENYDEEYLKNNAQTIGHLLQLLWKPYYRMGVGVAKDTSEKYYIVANYNVMGESRPSMLGNLPTFNKADIDTASSDYARAEYSGESQTM